MGEPLVFEQRRHLGDAMARMSTVASVEALVDLLRTFGRGVAASDGVTVIRREGDHVAYLAEDSRTPLWAGKRFPIDACISGMAIVERRPIHIPDIYVDPRVPHAAYRPTFVRSMAMYPIGLVEPLMAIGAYWGEAREIDPGAAALLSSLARFAGVTLGRLSVSRAA